MNKKKLILTVVSAVVAVAILIACFFIINNVIEAKGDGTISIEVVALDGSLMKEKDVVFHEGDTLQKLIEDNFDSVIFDDTGYGPFIKGIEGYVTPDDWSSYISILVDGIYSEVGIGDIVFVDGTKITLKISSFE